MYTLHNRDGQILASNESIDHLFRVLHLHRSLLGRRGKEASTFIILTPDGESVLA